MRTDVKNSFDSTTAQMKQVFVKLADLPTENRMLGIKQRQVGRAACGAPLPGVNPKWQA